jgi:hypothetical protein
MMLFARKASSFGFACIVMVMFAAGACVSWARSYRCDDRVTCRARGKDRKGDIQAQSQPADKQSSRAHRRVLGRTERPRN